MKKVKVKSVGNYLFPVPTVIVGSIVDGKPTFNTLGNFGLMALSPLTIYISAFSKHYTMIGIKENRRFSANIPSSEQVVETDYVGIVSGHRKDKSKVFEVFFGEQESVPLISECPVNMSCRVIKQFMVGRMEVSVAVVEELFVDEDCVLNDKADLEKINPLALYHDRTYREMGKIAGKTFQIGKEYKDWKEKSA